MSQAVANGIMLAIGEIVLGLVIISGLVVFVISVVKFFAIGAEAAFALYDRWRS